MSTPQLFLLAVPLAFLLWHFLHAQKAATSLIEGWARANAMTLLDSEPANIVERLRLRRFFPQVVRMMRVRDHNGNERFCWAVCGAPIIGMLVPRLRIVWI